jgi:hypothetical protein
MIDEYFNATACPFVHGAPPCATRAVKQKCRIASYTIAAERPHEIWCELASLNGSR